jgi:uncharacterized NAD-dependent epimerase/dehydratase family protein
MVSVGNVQGAVSQPLSDFSVDLVISYPPNTVLIAHEVFKVTVRSKPFDTTPE